MSNQFSIEARNISVRFGEKVLLDTVSIELNAGEVLIIIGENGSGKSTLRKALCGDISLARGEVLMNKRALAQWSLIERARVRAVMGQDTTLNFPFTVLEVTLMGRAPHLRGSESETDYAIARAALQAVEAEHLEERLFPTLSGGERQRVQLARALAQVWDANDGSDAPETRYLLLDEPTSNLDLAHQQIALTAARKFARAGAGVLLILHDLNLAAQYADRIAVLKNGKLIARGAPSEILTPELIREAFGVRVVVAQHPQMNCPLIITLPD